MESWKVSRIRETFFSHFELREYNRLSPNPFITLDNSTPPIEGYLNHFIQTVDDTLKIDSRKTSCYSLRCITLGDDGNFCKDSSYHCCTELLGTWASGGKCKHDAVTLSWELLTKRYKLPRDKIYIKYFAGYIEEDPDDESLEMWKRYVPQERILPSKPMADFWRAGDTGPCGPSFGILFDVSDRKTTDNRFVEICRLVCVQFDRQQDGDLRHLPVSHVITGMNVESLASILQKKTSHYDSDVFSHMFGVIEFAAGDGVVKYSGKVGNNDTSKVDAAYRVLADHLRIISAATSYCAEHGLQTKHREDILKHADRRAVTFGHKILDTKFDLYAILLNNALRIAAFYPVQVDEAKINTIIEDEVKIYKKIRAEDEQGLLLGDAIPAIPHSNLPRSLPKPKKEQKNTRKNQRGKQQQQKRPPRLPPASVNNEDDTAQLPPVSVEKEDNTAHLPPTSVENEDYELDKVDVPANIGGPDVEISSSPKSVAPVHNTGVVYPLKQIDFLGHSTYIICQEKKGPCPLISICNSLLLKRKISFECHLAEVPMERLVHIVQDLVKDCLKIKVCYSFAKGAILDIVPTLAEGLDVDVKFNRTDGFTATPGTLLFDCLEIPLFHGWLADRKDMAEVLSHSFETLTWAVKEPHFPNVEKVKKFLDGHQLTAYGLSCLYEDVNENVPSVHYWNKHFSTIIKYKGALYSLVSDAGYLNTNVVWQTLNDINGGGSYLCSDFTPIDLELVATPSGEKVCAPCGFPETYFKKSKMHGMSLDKFILDPGNKFSVLKTLFSAGTPLDVAATTITGRVVALDILRDLISAHSAGYSYNGAFGLSSIFLYNGHATIRAPFCGQCTDDTMSMDFETYISDILEIFRIDKVGLPAFFERLISLLRRPGDFIHHRYFWDCVWTTLALKSPLSRAGLFSGLHRIRRLAPNGVQSSLHCVLKPSTSDWRELIFRQGHPLLKKVLMYNPDKSLEDKGDEGAEERPNEKKFARYHRTLHSVSIFPRQVNEHGKPKDENSKAQGSKHEVKVFQSTKTCMKDEGSKAEGSKQKVEEFQTTNTCVKDEGSKVLGSKQEVEEREEPFELLSDLDLLYSHYLEDSLDTVLEMLLTSNDMSPELWEWVREVLKEYDKPEGMDPAPYPWDRS